MTPGEAWWLLLGRCILAFGILVLWALWAGRRSHLAGQSRRPLFQTGIGTAVVIVAITVVVWSQFPGGVSPFQPEFWLGAKLPFGWMVEHWVTTVKSVLQGLCWGLVILWLQGREKRSTWLKLPSLAGLWKREKRRDSRTSLG